MFTRFFGWQLYQTYNQSIALMIKRGFWYAVDENETKTTLPRLFEDEHK